MTVDRNESIKIPKWLVMYVMPGLVSLVVSYTSLYWTSSQSDSANAWVQSFYDGTQNIRNIIAGVAIRAIRYF